MRNVKEYSHLTTFKIRENGYASDRFITFNPLLALIRRYLLWRVAIIKVTLQEFRKCCFPFLRLFSYMVEADKDHETFATTVAPKILKKLNGREITKHVKALRTFDHALSVNQFIPRPN